MEAAVLYPFIIVTAVSLIFILISVYQMVQIKTELSRMALRESGIRAEAWNLSGEEIREGYFMDETRRTGYRSIEASFVRSYGDWGILNRTREKPEKSSFTAARESEIIRKAEIAGE